MAAFWPPSRSAKTEYTDLPVRPRPLSASAHMKGYEELCQGLNAPLASRIAPNRFPAHPPSARPGTFPTMNPSALPAPVPTHFQSGTWLCTSGRSMSSTKRRSKESVKG